MTSFPEDPLSLAKADYREVIERISLQDSPVGIDAQYTHAIIIRFLQQIESRLAKVEQILENRNR